MRKHIQKQVGEAEEGARLKVQSKAKVALFLSVDSFEGFYGGIFGLTRESFLNSYRNDFVWEYAAGLVELGHQVSLYILSYGKPERHEISPGLSARFLRISPWLRLVDPFVYRLSKVGFFGALRDRVAFWAYSGELMKALEMDGIDLLYHQEIWTPRFDVLTAHINMPMIGAEHGAVYKPWMNSAKIKSIPRASKLTCQSREGLDRVHQFSGHGELLFNGVDTNFFSLAEHGSAPRSKVVLSVGRFVEDQKRFADLLWALTELPDFSLVLVGRGPAEEFLKRLAEELGLSARVSFPGFISDRTVLRRLYRECGVFVSTSAWEAVALVVLEAMSCEMPVVCTRIPSFEELVIDEINGILVPVGDPGGVAIGIRVAYEAGKSLGENARRTVLSKYSAMEQYSKLSRIIEDVVYAADRMW